ncbi:hypothetical protein [Hyphomicrobium sp.]|uniref:hypothetical protein n=1 Tax=Hyphomicrobium sp. TaxID=82 RepID=UPI002E335F6E|nr:hypothetical protein [Hyphomicrobium sp.]HEX2840867.1 hypothetical protein [Hyphomicrobium sp.]
MSSIAGWRIQVRPQYCDSDLTSSEFFNIRIAHREAAIASVRNRRDASPGERIYTVRPLRHEEFTKPAASG